MPYLVRVGLDKTNISGTTCKGYFVGRKGKRVIVLNGAIDVLRRKYYWAGPNLPMKTEYRRRTEREAAALARHLVKNQLKHDSYSGGYTRLPGTKRILSYRFNPKRWL